MRCERKIEQQRARQAKEPDRLEYTRQDSNLQPSVPKTDALSSCATGAKHSESQDNPPDTNDHSKNRVAFEGLSCGPSTN